MNSITEYQIESPSNLSYWRSIILFGKNVASYKFALAKSLLELSESNKTSILLEDLAVPFSTHICDHLKHSPKQVTSSSSKFLAACKNFNDEKITKDELIYHTTKLGFNNVIDAFHVVNQESIPIEFFVKNYSNNKKIMLTDDLFKIVDKGSTSEIFEEIESRWNLVETAWELGVSRNSLAVYHDKSNSRLFVLNQEKRKNVTSVRPSIIGYQKGKCFYCYDDISIDPNDDNLCDVDHFFPYALKTKLKIDFNGVWNLVLACKECNRGEQGKFSKIPKTTYLNRLKKRNEYLICSHHPLRDTLIRQTGNYRFEREMFYKEIDKSAIELLVHRWETPEKGPRVF